jgi:hypothetical protein
VFFTDFVPDPNMQYGLGYSMVTFISVLIFVNLLLIFWFGSKSVKFIFIKYYRRVRRFFDPNFMKVNEPELMPKKPDVPIL